jgi:hypothetical protein
MRFIIVTMLLLLSNIAMAVENESSEGKAIEADGLKNDSALSISGTKFEDANRNAIFNEGERGLSGWVIRLKLNDRDVSNTTTNESGFYAFTNLRPGEYNVTEDQQPGWMHSYPGSGYYNIYLSDKSGYGYDFGNFRCSIAPVRLSSASVRSSRAPDEYDEDPGTYIDENGNVQYLTAMRVTPEMIAKEAEDYYKRAPSALRPKRDVSPYSQGFSPG